MLRLPSVPLTRRQLQLVERRHETLFHGLETMNTPMMIGRQTFDGLGRHLSVDVGGHITNFHYRAGQLPPSANTLADGKRIEFTYESALNNQLLSVSAEGEPVQLLGYHPLGMPQSASGGLGDESFEFKASGQPSQDIWAVEDEEHVTTWHYSLNRLLQGFDDVQGTRHRRRLDAQGRVEEVHVGHLMSRYRYDPLSRMTHIDVEDQDGGSTLSTVLTYDSIGREHTRTFIATTQDADGDPATRILKQTLGYSALDQITSRHWSDGEQAGEETFAYDFRRRLVLYTADADIAPDDPFGNPIVEQRFTYNALNGHERVLTTFVDGSTNETLFSYASDDPVRVTKVTHSHPTWPSEVVVTYDECGRVIGDSLGRSMRWNAQGRLTSVDHESHHCEYGYTASGHLTDRRIDDTLSRSFFSGEEVTHERTGTDSLQFYSGEQGVFAIHTMTDKVRQTTLLGADAQGSVRLEADTTTRTRQYSAYGTERENAEHLPIGFAGQRVEPVTHWQILGDYRPYDPVLMCFLSPDSESPFGRGGINPYVYCAGDPVNRIDPDGHSWVNYALAGVGLAVGIAGTIASLGAASALITPIAMFGLKALTPSAVMIISAGILNVASVGTGAAALGIEMTGGDKRTANILGWVSLGTGIAASALTAIGHASARIAAKQVLQRRDSSILFERRLGSHDVVFHKKLWGDKFMGFETHGTPEGYLMNSKGLYDTAANVAKTDIAPLLVNMDPNRPFVLLACQGGSSGAAQEVANVLRRPVLGFHENIFVGTAKWMKQSANFVTKEGVRTPFALQQIPHLKGLTGVHGPHYFAHGVEYELASFQLYKPV
ncbi:RHS repeat domain-containing protein [Pseudomonas sp. SLFW]|uniref:RHS repeat domain-containing protein n=1 Tax=Pseudomonas sp. SLFW TaxID=2683259 RepID=UPI00211470BA|nr:RHS repeat-associated core domain-containing protein [Pseudomonas sp. SLFW]